MNQLDLSIRQQMTLGVIYPEPVLIGYLNDTHWADRRPIEYRNVQENDNSELQCLNLKPGEAKWSWASCQVNIEHSYFII